MIRNLAWGLLALAIGFGLAVMFLGPLRYFSFWVRGAVAYCHAIALSRSASRIVAFTS